MTKAINVLSLFDGISCGQVALHNLQIPINKYFSSEIDKYAIAITQKNFPQTIQLGDIQKLSSYNFPQIDLLIGGSPCQNFSFSGKRNGLYSQNILIDSLDKYLHLKQDNFEFEGASYLFWEYIFFLQKLAPKYFLLENTPMALQWLSIITQAVGVAPQLIDASLVSAQVRKRWYWTNIPFTPIVTDNHLYLKDILEPQGIDITARYNKIPPQTTAYKKSRSALRTIHQKAKCLTAGGQGISNNGATNIYINEELIRKLTPIECERLQGLPDNYTEGVSPTQRYKSLGNGWQVTVIMKILQALQKGV